MPLLDIADNRSILERARADGVPAETIWERFREHYPFHAEHDWFWPLRARPKQLPHFDKPWKYRNLRHGRRTGKTHSGAEMMHEAVWTLGAKQLAIAAPTSIHARRIMIRGPRGLLHTGPKGLEPTYRFQDMQVEWPNGAVADVLAAAQPTQGRGGGYQFGWADEPASYPDIKEENLWGVMAPAFSEPGARLIATSTPRASRFSRTLEEAPDALTSVEIMPDNAHNLEPGLQETLESQLTADLIQQEIYAVILPDAVGGLWTWPLLEGIWRMDRFEAERTVVAIDHAVTASDKSDYTAIAVASRNGDFGRLHRRWLEKESPQAWARRAINAYEQHNASAIVGETNQGGDLIEANLRAEGFRGRYIGQRRTGNKVAWAEPIVAMFERGQITFDTWEPADDRASFELELIDFPLEPNDGPDAMVNAFRELFVSGSPPIWMLIGDEVIA